MSDLVRIANAQGFWGDRVGQAARLYRQQPAIDYITMDYLAEVSLSILALQKEKAPYLGYAADFLSEVRALIPLWESGARVKLIANAGGLNPLACAQAVSAILSGSGAHDKKIGVVTGDNVLDQVMRGDTFHNLDTGEPVSLVREKLVSANAYLGAAPIAEALLAGADIVITGRVADPSMAVACALHHFGWERDCYDLIAQATVAGHLIECGTQATGGISTNWMDCPEPENMGYPVVELLRTGEFVVTKPEGTGGCVNEETVKEQLLYEIGDPDNYISPDAIVSLGEVTVEDLGNHRVKVAGARGKAPTATLKVSATYRNGYMAEGILTFFGSHVKHKARRAAEMVLSRVAAAGFVLERTQIDCIGTGDVVPGTVASSPEGSAGECVLRLAVADPRKEAIECFAKEMAPLVTSGPQGTTGYFGGRPRPRPVFGFWPCLIDSTLVRPEITILEAVGK